MRGQKRAFVVDFDNTLLDIERRRNDIVIKLGNKTDFFKSYENAKKPFGYFDPKRLPEKYQKFFYQMAFKKYLFPKVLANLRKLKKLGRVIIFTHGDPAWQKLKIKKSGVAKVVGTKNILIAPEKIRATDDLVRKLRQEKYAEIIIFDDTAEILERAFRTNPQTVTVWIRYGKNKNKPPVLKNSITYEAPSFNLGCNFATRFIGVITPSKSHLNLPVLKGIDKSQISDLVSYTGRDRKVSVCTHDGGRFRNIKTFISWRKRGKIIYTLTNRTGRLLGIIWFAKKKYGTFPFTIAVRTYPPIRGKGLSYKFMKKVYDNFKSKHPKAGLWLSMQRNNTPAEHLYKKFDFVKSEEKNSEVILTLK